MHTPSSCPRIAADSAGHPDLARAIFWQNGLLQGIILLHNIGTEQDPVYEGGPLNIRAFYASIPLGFILYAIISYATLRFIQTTRLNIDVRR